MSKRKLTDSQVMEAQKMRDAGVFYEEIGKKLGVSYATAYRALNPKAEQSNRIYCLKHNKAKYANNEEFRHGRLEYGREYTAKYYKAHKDDPAWQLRNKENKRKSRKKHPGDPAKHAAVESARRAFILGATIGNLAEIKEIYRQVKEDPKVRCYLCGKLIPMGHRHVDHIIPLSKGGAHRSSNLAAACDTCNQRKHNKLPEEIGVLL